MPPLSLPASLGLRGKISAILLDEREIWFRLLLVGTFLVLFVLRDSRRERMGFQSTQGWFLWNERETVLGFGGDGDYESFAVGDGVISVFRFLAERDGLEEVYRLCN